MLLINPTVGLANKLPIPSAKILPTAENTLGFARPVSKLPMFVLLPTKGATDPVVPGGVTGTGTIIPDPLEEVLAAVAPSRKNPDLDAVNPNDPTMSPFPEHCRACNAGVSTARPASSVIAAVPKPIPCFIDSY